MGLQWRQEVSLSVLNLMTYQMGTTQIIHDFDTSRFENCWPALAKDVNGVLLVYSPDNAQKEKELERWYVKKRQPVAFFLF